MKKGSTLHIMTQVYLIEILHNFMPGGLENNFYLMKFAFFFQDLNLLGHDTKIFYKCAVFHNRKFIG